MKILYFLDVGERYGATESFYQMIDSLRENYSEDVEIVVVTSGSGRVKKWAEAKSIECFAAGHGAFFISPGSNTVKRFLKKLGTPLLYLDYKARNLMAMRRVEQTVDLKTIDVIHSNVNRNDIGAIIAEKYSIPHVWHIREFGEIGLGCRSLKRNYISYMNNHADIFILISNAVADYWATKGLDKRKIVILSDCTMVPEANRLPRDILADDKIRIVFVGGFVRMKGQGQLVEAINLLPEHIQKQIHVDFYGDGGEYLKEVKEKCSAYGLNDILSFHGYVDNISEKLIQYDIGVVSSYAEGLGRVTIEYMESGCLVIGADTAATNEIVTDGVTGLLYEYGNSADLAAKLLYAIQNTKKTQDIAKAGQTYALSFYSGKKYSAALMSIYKAALKTKEHK